MTVSELIEHLKTMPPDAQVQVFHEADERYREHYKDLVEVEVLPYPRRHVEFYFEAV